MSRVGRLLLWTRAPLTLRKFAAVTRSPVESRDRLLREILRTNAGSAFGRRHGFAGITSFPQYQDRVPVAQYEDLEPYITRAMNGEPNQLTKHPPVLFTTTSGTTGASKYIPMTREGKEAKSRLTWLWLCGLYRDHPGHRRRADPQRGQPGDRGARAQRRADRSRVRARLPHLAAARCGRCTRRRTRSSPSTTTRPSTTRCCGWPPGRTSAHRDGQPQHDRPAGRPAGQAHRVDHPGCPGRAAVARVRRARASIRGSLQLQPDPDARRPPGAGGRGRRRGPAAGPRVARNWLPSGAGRAARSAPIWPSSTRTSRSGPRSETSGTTPPNCADRSR